ncbi:MAG TPA: c-type cytochrome [Gammaproteobacteria bacterium]|nr:c-type cytochrome [Gammaproteobacteria bacterium]
MNANQHLAGVLAAGTAALLLLAAGAAGAADRAVQAGEQIFMDNCAVCHGKDARGDGPMADELKTRPADLTVLAKKNGGTFPTQEVYRVIDGSAANDSLARVHGPQEMPVWGTVFSKRMAGSSQAAKNRIKSVERYLQSIQEK